MSLCNYTPEDLHSSPPLRERDERRERQRHVIAALTERGGDERWGTQRRGGQKDGEWWWGFNKPPLSLVYRILPIAPSLWHTNTHMQSLPSAEASIILVDVCSLPQDRCVNCCANARPTAERFREKEIYTLHTTAEVSLTNSRSREHKERHGERQDFSTRPRAHMQAYTHTRTGADRGVGGHGRRKGSLSVCRCPTPSLNLTRTSLTSSQRVWEEQWSYNLLLFRYKTHSCKDIFPLQTLFPHGAREAKHQRDTFNDLLLLLKWCWGSNLRDRHAVFHTVCTKHLLLCAECA